MDNKDLLLKEIREIPDPLLGEILDFVQFLKTRLACEKLDAAIMSESSLNKDWLKPEEDEAWQSL